MSDPRSVRKVHTEDAPAAIGPYSQAIVHAGLVFCSGQIAIDPETNEFQGGDVEEETRRVLENLSAVLEAAGTSLERALKLTVYLAKMDDFARVNAVYAEYFPKHRPARAAVEVARLPKDAKVEIDCIAAL
ncbi:MAG: RidA family protein [Planctomycetota bacterium]|nr:RidA family protein [Planctomycetota bacterium]